MTYSVILCMYPVKTVGTLFITSLTVNEFSCDEVHIPCLCNQQRNVEVVCVYTLKLPHNLEQRHSVFSRGCVEKYRMHGDTSQTENDLLQKPMRYLRFTE